MSHKVLTHIKLLNFQIRVLNLLISLNRFKKLKKRRRWLVRPINQNRRHAGFFATIFQEAKEDPDIFFKLTRMDLKTYNYLLDNLSPYLQKDKSNISAEERLSVTLRYLSSGDRVFSIALEYRMGESTCYDIILETCSIICQRMSPVFLAIPTEEEWKQYSLGFWTDWNMPNCIGAVDGKHIHIKAPANSGSVYFNYKKSFSIILLAVCNHEYKFTLVDVGAVGSESDGGVLSRSELGKAIRSNNLNIPKHNVKLPNSDVSTPYYFVGDEAFGLSSNMMRPYSGRHLEEKKAIFNYRLSRARRIIENSFGILVARWQFLSKPVGFQPSSVMTCLLASLCLHNFLMGYSNESRLSYCAAMIDPEIEYHIAEREESVHLLQDDLHSQVLNGSSIRDSLADYFMSPEGEVPWQKEAINRGSYRDN